MFNKRLFTGVMLACALSVLSAGAQMWHFHDPLSGSQEVPPNSSPATGIAMGTYDQATRTLRIMVNASGFQSNLLFGHIHRGAVGVNGPVVFFLNNTSSDPRVWTSDDTFTLTSAQEADFLAGLWYVNLHTQVLSGGEIRGQLNPIPEPASLVFLGAGVAGLLWRRRK
ncbi:PEP-CTERM protein-sorting domain-containing protein [Armatimonadetes bacterium DC]|nr:PEP-CTERM protein-sorting domain-containing protein [Armatimonadetes bacterium DC]